MSIFTWIKIAQHLHRPQNKGATLNQRKQFHVIVVFQYFGFGVSVCKEVVVVIYGCWLSNYMCNQCLSPLMLWVRTPLRRLILDTTLCDKVCQWPATDRWFSPVSSTNKTDHDDITEILLEVILNTINLNKKIYKDRHITSRWLSTHGTTCVWSTLSSCATSLMSTYLLCLVDVFFNIQSIYLWVQTVLLLFLYSYEADFIQGLLKKSEKKLARYFNFTFRYIDDVLSLNNSTFGDLVDRIYPIELEIKDTTDTARSASYLDLPRNGQKGPDKNETLRQKRWFQFSHCELSIYM